MKKFWALFLFLVACTSPFLLIEANAQEPIITATAPAVVSVGEQFRVTYVINDQPDDFRPPQFTNFNFLGGPSTSSSNSVEMVNGKVTRNSSFTYTFYLQAIKEGKFTIGAASIKSDGKSYTSNTLDIEVVKGSDPVPQQATRGQQQNSETQSSDIQGVDGKDLFARIISNKSSVYQGEEVVLTLKIYTRLNLSGFEDFTFPSYNGFYSQDIETPSQVSLQRENVNGQIFNTAIIKQNLVFPQRSGKLTIEPFKIDCIIRQQVGGRSRSVFDEFFGASYQNVKKQIISNTLVLNVKPLPDEKPTSFKGAVGSYSTNVTLDKQTLTANDALTLKVSLSGNGNIALAEPPVINFPHDFEVYDPKISTNVKYSTNGASGSKTFEYLVIPRHSGKFRIAPIEYSWFDPTSGRYKSSTSPEYNINVLKSDEDQTGTVISGLSKEDVRYIGQDIRYIKTGDPQLKKKGSFFFGSFIFWMFYIIPFLLFIIIIYLRRQHIKRNSNIVQVKNRKAHKMASKRLKTAAVHLKNSNNEKFYEEMLKALWGYVSDKLSIPVSDLSKPTTMEALQNKGVEPSIIEKIMSLINLCEYARYAPPSQSGNMNDIYKEAEKTIVTIEQQMK